MSNWSPRRPAHPPSNAPVGPPPSGGGTGKIPPIRVEVTHHLDAADAMLDRVYQIAEDLVAIEATGPTAQHARRAGRRICNIIDQVDEALGLDGEYNATS